jgi:hypothetical protein
VYPAKFVILGASYEGTGMACKGKVLILWARSSWENQELKLGLVGVQEASGHGITKELGAAPQTQLFHDVRPVSLDSGDADGERLSDLLAGVALGH